MGGTHSQTTLVFNKRGDVRLDSLSRFHLNSQWKRSVTSHDEVILSFTLKRVNMLPALSQQVRSGRLILTQQQQSLKADIMRSRNISFPV